ncbi:MAG: hypothetical protein HY912_05445 [Desulfomonile tiedjei]|uniref:Secreted protein n=1 Tax=Desulfomonile tiedjei TaxID=2358 RepID=A0A9D6V1I6_9BACT|nr:hypothetical protein [Desulfomonile tiedjei]
MRRPLMLIAVASSLFCLHLGSAEADDPDARVRICVKGHHNTGMIQGKGVVVCAKCELKAASSSPENKCRDFADLKKALKYWDKYCCD